MRELLTFWASILPLFVIMESAPDDRTLLQSALLGAALYLPFWAGRRVGRSEMAN